MAKLNSATYVEAIERFKTILQPERSFYVVAIIYGAGVSLLTLAIPISVQSLVNTVSFGVLTQPLIILSLVLFFLLIFSGVLQALQKYILELFQRKIYTRTTTEVVSSILHAHPRDFRRINGMELTNRYFDIMKIQKNVTSLLMDTIAMFLSTFVGLLLLAFYHPYFLVFDFLLIFFLWLVWYLYGKNAVLTAINESSAKYNTANWLQEIARQNDFFKSLTRRNFAAKQADDLIVEYIDSRKSHFKYLFAQIIFLVAIYAFMSSLILGLGGFLVINGQLTIGQLVAAELIITIILQGIAKSGKHLESFYDLFASTYKLSQLYNIKEDENFRSDLKKFEDFDLEFSGVNFKSGKYTFDFNFNFKAGKGYQIRSAFNSTRTLFIDLVNGIYEANTGTIFLGGHPINLLNPLQLRDAIFVVNRPTHYHGTLMENLTCGVENVSRQKINEVLQKVELDDLDSLLTDGLETSMLPSGYPLWASQLIRFEIAKAIILKPKIIIFTEIVEQIELTRRLAIIDYIRSLDITLIVFASNDYCPKDMERFIFERNALTTEDKK